MRRIPPRRFVLHVCALAIAAWAGCGESSKAPGGVPGSGSGETGTAAGSVASRFISKKIVKDLESGDPQTVMAAIEAATSSKDMDSVPTLIRLMGTFDIAIRFKAASALGRIGGREAMDALMARARDQDQYVREGAIFGLGESDDVRAVPEIRRAAADPQPNVRKAAICALGLRRDAASFDLIAGGLADGEMVVRQAAIYAFTEIGDPRSHALVEKCWKGDEDVRMRIWAAHALHKAAGRMDAYEYLLAMLKDENPVARFTSANMLGAAGDKAAVAALAEALRDGEDHVRISAAAALSKITGQKFGPDYAAWKDWIEGGTEKK